MENEDDSFEENPSEKRTVDHEDATRAEHSPQVESNISVIKTTSREEGEFTMNGENSFPGKTANGDNNALKETNSESCSKEEVNGTEERDGFSSRDGPSAKPEREIKSSEKSGDDGRHQRQRQRRPLRDIIGKREQRREELERTEGDLRQRLDMLECSVPAVMMWNMWLGSRGAPVCKIKRVLAKQFKDAAASELGGTPSRHYDCRVREAEAERKLALKKVEEARALWTEKLATLEERKRKLEETRRIQKEQNDAMERLSEEAKTLREAMEKAETDESCRHGECGDTRCKRRWLDKVPSVMSIESGDIECLEKLQRLAEEEINMKRDIAELERREEAYMRTLQRAEEVWSKMEDDEVGTTSELREQLNMKIAANQQLAERVCELEDALENCKTKMATCRAELEKFVNIEKIEAIIGRDDDVAQVADKKVAVTAKVVHRPIGRSDDVATVKDRQELARVEVADKKILAKVKVAEEETSDRVEVTDKETLTRVEIADEETSARTDLIDADAEAISVTDDKDAWIKPDSADLAVDRQIDLVRIEDAESAVRPEDLAYEQQKLKETRKYLSQLKSIEELYEEGVPCPPGFPCNNVVSSPTGMTDEESIALGIKPAESAGEVDRGLTFERETEERLFTRELVKEANGVTDYVEEKEKKADRIPDVEIERKAPEKTEEERITEDVPVGKVVTRREIRERVDESPVTTPDDAGILKVEKDGAVVVQRDSILSWVDAIDTIRATIAKHPTDCYAAKEDADILAEKIGATIGVKPKEVAMETDLTVREIKQREAIEEIEIKTKLDVEAESEPDKGDIKSVPEVPAELPQIDLSVKIQAEPVTSPGITIKETKMDIERAEDLKINEREEGVTIETKLKDKLMVREEEETEPAKKDESIPPLYSEEISAEGPTEPSAPLSQLLPDLTKKETLPDTEAFEPVSMEDSLRHPTVPVEKGLNGRALIAAESEKVKIEKEAEVKEAIITERAEIPSAVAEMEVEPTIERLIDEEPEKEVTMDDKIERKEIVSERADEILTLAETEAEDAKETRDTKPVTEIGEVEQPDAEKVIPTVVMKETEQLPRAGEIPLIVDLIEIEKPSELPIAEETPIADVMEEEIKVKETPPISDIKEDEVKAGEELPIPDAVTEEKVPIEEPAALEIAFEAPSRIADAMIEEKIEEPKPIEEPSLITDAEEEIETIRPTAEPEIGEEMEATVPEIEVEREAKREIEEVPEAEEMEQPVAEIEMEEIQREREERIEEIEERKELEELPPTDEGEIPTEITPFAEPTVEEEEEEEALLLPEEEPEVIGKIPIIEVESVEAVMRSIVSQLMAQPYFVITQMEERELVSIETVISKPSFVRTTCRSPAISFTQPPAETAQSVEITRVDVVQETEVVQITTPPAAPADERTLHTPPPVRIISEYLKPAEPKASAEVAGDLPEITGRKILWRIRLKDQSTVTTASTGSQTDKTSRVSHDRVERGERARVPTAELLRSIKIAAGLVRGDTGREIRTINYGKRTDEEAAACNCCRCGGITPPPSSSPTRQPREPRPRPRVDVKTATTTTTTTTMTRMTPPPAAATAVVFGRAYNPRKIDGVIPYNKLCPDCKTEIQGELLREWNQHERIIGKISCDQRETSSALATSVAKASRAVSRKITIEKRDRSCLAKISRRKVDATERKRKDDSSKHAKTADEDAIEPLSPSCICFKLAKSGAKPARKGNCYCAD